MNSRVQPEKNAVKSRGGDATSSRSAQTERLRPSGGAADIITDVRNAAKSTGETLKHQASDLGEEVGHELNKAATAQKQKGAEALRGFAGAMNAAAEHLDSQSPAVAERVRDTASKFEALSDGISEKDVSDLLKSAADLARDQPAWFLGGAVAAGFGLTRFLMSNPPQRTPTHGNQKTGTHRHGS